MPSITMLPHRQVLAEVDRSTLAVTCRATDYRAGTIIDKHAHAKHQLIYAVHGVMTVHTEGGQWVVPSTRAIWMPAGMTHSIRCIGVVHMRSLYVRPDAAPNLPLASQVVGVSPLLRELIQAAVAVRTPYSANSRDGRLMRLMLDELRVLPVLPLHLPLPSDASLRRICERLQQRPDDLSTLGDWAAHLRIDVKTIQRRFARETSMTFGQWRQQARLLRALERLAGGDKIVDIALGLGYDSPSAFATMFKRQFGLTPSQFFS
jgi:AraC-like DNA-binding protein/mannose-6-phosphate isomerase-like protein (cupin superfamily)